MRPRISQVSFRTTPPYPEAVRRSPPVSVDLGPGGRPPGGGTGQARSASPPHGLGPRPRGSGRRPNTPGGRPGRPLALATPPTGRRPGRPPRGLGPIPDRGRPADSTPSATFHRSARQPNGLRAYHAPEAVLC